MIARILMVFSFIVHNYLFSHSFLSFALFLDGWMDSHILLLPDHDDLFETLALTHLYLPFYLSISSRCSMQSSLCSLFIVGRSLHCFSLPFPHPSSAQFCVCLVTCHDLIPYIYIPRSSLETRVSVAYRPPPPRTLSSQVSPRGMLIAQQ